MAIVEPILHYKIDMNNLELRDGARIKYCPMCGMKLWSVE